MFTLPVCDGHFLITLDTSPLLPADSVILSIAEKGRPPCVGVELRVPEAAALARELAARTLEGCRVPLQPAGGCLDCGLTFVSDAEFEDHAGECTLTRSIDLRCPHAVTDGAHMGRCVMRRDHEGSCLA